MNNRRLIVASTRPDAGKTSLILGLFKNLDKKCGYLKPMGDRLLYKKKRLWDHDASLMTRVFDLESEPEDMTLGFEHAKLEYMYERDDLRQKLNEVVDKIGNVHDFTVIESGEDISFGSYVNLSAIDMAEFLDTKIVLVASGGESRVIDDLTYLSKTLDMSIIKGVIVNRQPNAEEFKDNYKDKIEELGFSLLGVIPENSLLSRLTVEQIADDLMAKVITSSENLDRSIDHIDVGAMSISEVRKQNIFNKENNLVITSGDRPDVIISALECNPSAIVLTNGILPPKNIIAIAEQKGVPLLSVSIDTFQTAKKVDDIKSLIFSTNSDKINCMKELISKNVDVNAIVME